MTDDKALNFLPKFNRDAEALSVAQTACFRALANEAWRPLYIDDDVFAVKHHVSVCGGAFALKSCARAKLV